MKKVLSIGLLVLGFSSCDLLPVDEEGNVQSPLVFTVSIDAGNPIIKTDFEKVLLLGEGQASISWRFKGSTMPYWQQDFFMQTGDYWVIDGGESHHYPYSQPLSEKFKALFTDQELADLALQGITLQFSE